MSSINTGWMEEGDAGVYHVDPRGMWWTKGVGVAHLHDNSEGG